MNKETLQGKWHEIQGKIKEKWGKLTDNDLAEINGKREALLGKIQTRYGIAKERAEKELSEFEKSCQCEHAGVTQNGGRPNQSQQQNPNQNRNPNQNQNPNKNKR